MPKAAKKPFADGAQGLRGLYGMVEAVQADAGLDPSGKLSALPAVASPGSVSGTRVGAGPCTSTLVTMVVGGPADAIDTYWWRQISGAAMTISDPRAAAVTFSATLADGGSASAVFGCTVYNDYGQRVEASTVSVVLNSTPSYTPMSISSSPSGQTYIYTDANGDAFASFSVSVSGGQPPYTYNWGGGPGDGTPTNYINVHLDPGGFYDFAPGCTVTDATAATIGAAPGPFTFIRPL